MTGIGDKTFVGEECIAKDDRRATYDINDEIEGDEWDWAVLIGGEAMVWTTNIWKKNYKNSREESQTNLARAIGGPDVVYSSDNEEYEYEAVCNDNGRADFVRLRMNTAGRFAGRPDDPDTK